MDNHPAKDVTVTWANGTTRQSVKTDANGKASAILDYAEYTVSLTTLPAGSLCTWHC